MSEAIIILQVWCSLKSLTTTLGILFSLHSVFRAVRKSCCPQKWEKYNKLRIEVVSLMREAKTSYFARIDPSRPKDF